MENYVNRKLAEDIITHALKNMMAATQLDKIQCSKLLNIHLTGCQSVLRPTQEIISHQESDYIASLFH